jgi:hypothetical protein
MRYEPESPTMIMSDLHRAGDTPLVVVVMIVERAFLAAAGFCFGPHAEDTTGEENCTV